MDYTALLSQIDTVTSIAANVVQLSVSLAATYFWAKKRATAAPSPAPKIKTTAPAKMSRRVEPRKESLRRVFPDHFARMDALSA